MTSLKAIRQSIAVRVLPKAIGEGLLSIHPTETGSPDDVYIAGFPKSGNTWVQLMVACLQFGLDPETVPDSIVQDLVPDVHARRWYRRFTTPTLFKTHFLPREDYRRVIYLVRDGRDALVSYHHYNRGLMGAEAPSWQDMVYNDKGLFPCSWAEHVRRWHANPFAAELLILRYEDLKQNAAQRLTQIAAFIGAKASESRIQEIADRSNFSKMKKREQTLGWDDPNWPKDVPFVRKGASGGYKSEMSPDLIAAFEAKSKDALETMGYQLDSTHVAIG